VAGTSSALHTAFHFGTAFCLLSPTPGSIGISINALRKNLSGINDRMDRECASSAAGYDIALDASLKNAELLGQLVAARTGGDVDNRCVAPPVANCCRPGL
jgi:hypothetical protein